MTGILRPRACLAALLVVLAAPPPAARAQDSGWKLGLPAFLVAGYVGLERVTQQKHWPSDVVAGATLGVISGRTVTLHVRRERFNVHPQIVPGGGALMIRVQHAQSGLR